MSAKSHKNPRAGESFNASIEARKIPPLPDGSFLCLFAANLIG
jgi:hypothetical protein